MMFRSATSPARVLCSNMRARCSASAARETRSLGTSRLFRAFAASQAAFSEASGATTSAAWPSGGTVCLDLGLREHRGDPWVVSDLEASGWIERYSAQDNSLAPAGEQLVQAQMPIRPGESAEDAGARLEELLALSFEDWRGRVTWRRRQVMDGRSGALDLPGTTWHDRPAIDRGNGTFLCGDQVAAPGCLSEVSFASAIEAGKLALKYSGDRALRQVA